jgi:hypothetical protein
MNRTLKSNFSPFVSKKIKFTTNEKLKSKKLYGLSENYLLTTYNSNFSWSRITKKNLIF